jgi:hypothetical protein
VVGTRRHDVGFFPRFSFNNPFSKRVNKAETLGTSRLNHNEHAAILQSLPESLHYQLPCLGCTYFLQNITQDNQVKFASISAGNHSKRVDPQYIRLKLLLSQEFAQLTHRLIRLYSSNAIQAPILVQMFAGPSARAESSAIVQRILWLEVGESMRDLIENPTVYLVMVGHFAVQESDSCFTGVLELKLLLLFGFISICF